MSVVTLGKDAPKLSAEEVTNLAGKADIKVQEAHIDDFGLLLGALDQSVKSILDEEDYVPKPDLEKYPRKDISIPKNDEESDKGGWATKCHATATSPTSDLLRGKTIALKDNIAFAGMRCTNGTGAMDWTPKVDATIATRILDAGAIITGKAACENACLEGVSDTSVTGNVHNPYADGYSCGGSSSGSGRLVASGAVDMAIGCDQGGSIRIPASMCGIVGHKPTWGLVPYTGIVSLECTIDHAGPMARSVPDAAALLEVIAGSDGIDDRQPPFLPDAYTGYSSKLSEFLKNTEGKEKPLEGIKIGALDEGFTIANMDPNVQSLCKKAVSHFRTLGAEVKVVEIPSHTNAAVIWMCSVPVAGGRQSLLSDMSGRKQLYMIDRIVKAGKKMSQEAFDALSPAGQNMYLRHLYLYEKFGPELHAKCSNLLRKISDDYDRTLRDVDVLVMPTLPSPPCKLFDKPSEHGPLARLVRNVGLTGNTSPFNSTGHPALSIPVGFVPAQDDESVKLPAGLMIVGRKWEDSMCLKVGAAWERSVEWKTWQS